MDGETIYENWERIAIRYDNVMKRMEDRMGTAWPPTDWQLLPLPEGVTVVELFDSVAELFPLYARDYRIRSEVAQMENRGIDLDPLSGAVLQADWARARSALCDKLDELLELVGEE